MFDVNSNTKELALQSARRIYVTLIMGKKTGTTWENDRTYTGDNFVSSLAVDIGNSGGGMQIGNAYCSKLTLKLLEGAIVSQTDRIIVRVGFRKEDGTQSDPISLGWFYVDTITKRGKQITVVAYDKMLRAQKNYKSSLVFPTTLSAMLGEICDKMNVSLASDVLPFSYDGSVSTEPIKGNDSEGNKIYYTRREALSYIASAVGGNFFFDAGGHLALTRFLNVSDSFLAENSIELEISDESYTVSGISWLINGVTYSRDADAFGVIEFENKLDVSPKELMMGMLEQKLVGLSYHGATIKRQGCGWFELGDIVTAERAEGTTSPVLITGLNYFIEDGAFIENVYSSALTDSESNYTSGDVIGQTVPQSVASSETKKEAYTTAINFNSSGFVMTFENGGVAYTNTFAVTENASGQITKITNTTAGRSIDVTYD